MMLPVMNGIVKQKKTHHLNIWLYEGSRDELLNVAALCNQESFQAPFVSKIDTLTTW
jgi:hypothetical protein